MKHKMGSLFDGSGGFPLAGTLCGIEPIWASEVEPYPIAVTRSRFPNMKHLGSVTNVHGGEIEPVDIITFGSPCQDLSVAGKRAGLKHSDNGDDETTRSGLFMEAVRIIKEMREATNGEYPAFALWENVPGAFSSNKGEDFRTVLEELIKIVEPEAVMPAVPKNGWAYADCYIGDGWSLAYRVFDAQYWGVPQRRRRIYLVLDLRGERAGEVLFERESLRGHFEAGRTTREGTAGNATGCAGADDFPERVVWPELSNTISASTITGDHESRISDYTEVIIEEKPVYCIQGSVIDRDGRQWGLGVQKNISYTLTTIERPAVSYVYAIRGFGDYKGSDISSTIKSRDYKACTDLVLERSEYMTIVRRLTPTECARLQGFRDAWGHPECKEDLTEDEYRFWMDVRNTHAAINGKNVKEYSRAQMLKWYNKLHTDSSEYKMWGNGIALPTALYVMQGIFDAMERNDHG